VRQAGVIATAMVLAATALLIGTGDRGTAVSAAPERPSSEQLNLGVVGIDARIGDRRVRSSGAVVDARAGLVVTSAHTVWGATSLRLTTGLGILHGRLVARAPCAGLAVIEIQPRIPGLAALPVAVDGSPPSTELLSAVGRREGGLGGLLTIPLRTTGTTESATFENGLPPLTGAITLDGAVVPESSGGPLVNADGELVGMAMATTAGSGEQGALAIPWATVQQRLGELEVDKRQIYVGWRSYYRCAPQLHAYAQREHPGYQPIDAVINAPVPATRLPGTQTLDSQ
jgi:S1-C subfamily serine protease